VTLTLDHVISRLVTFTLDQVTLHNHVVHHSSTSTYLPNFIKIKETFCGWMVVRTDGRTFETHFIKTTQRVDLKIN